MLINGGGLIGGTERLMFTPGPRMSVTSFTRRGSFSKKRGPRLRTIWDGMIFRLKGIAKCGRSTHILISATATRRIRVSIGTTGKVAGILGRCSPRRWWEIGRAVCSSRSICGSWRLGLKLWRSSSWWWRELLTLRIKPSLCSIWIVRWGRCGILLLLLRVVRIFVRILSITSLLFLSCKALADNQR